MDITYAKLDPLMRVVAGAVSSPECPATLGRAGMAPPELNAADAGVESGMAVGAPTPHAMVLRGLYLRRPPVAAGVSGDEVERGPDRVR